MGSPESGRVRLTADPTNAERQRRHRLRLKLGWQRVIVGDDNYSVPPKLAKRIRAMCERATEAKETTDAVDQSA
jgi:hypothetical protein